MQIFFLVDDYLVISEKEITSNSWRYIPFLNTANYKEKFLSNCDRQNLYNKHSFSTK